MMSPKTAGCLFQEHAAASGKDDCHLWSAQLAGASMMTAGSVEIRCLQQECELR